MKHTQDVKYSEVKIRYYLVRVVSAMYMIRNDELKTAMAAPRMLKSL